MILASFPIALILGILGIVSDERRGPAVISTIVAGGCVLFYLAVIGFNLFCR